MFHGSRIMYLFLEMMVGDEPEKKDDLNFFFLERRFC